MKTYWRFRQTQRQIEQNPSPFTSSSSYSSWNCKLLLCFVLISRDKFSFSFSFFFQIFLFSFNSKFTKKKKKSKTVSTTALPFLRSSQDRSTHSPPSGPMESPVRFNLIFIVYIHFISNLFHNIKLCIIDGNEGLM